MVVVVVCRWVPLADVKWDRSLDPRLNCCSLGTVAECDRAAAAAANAAAAAPTASIAAAVPSTASIAAAAAAALEEASRHFEKDEGQRKDG